MKQADDYEALPAKAKARVDSGESSVPEEVAKSPKSKPTPDKPTNLLATAKEEAAQMRQLVHQIDTIKTELLELCGEPIGRFLHPQEIENYASDLRNAVAYAMPHARCAYCSDTDFQDCTKCRGNQKKGGGWVTKLTHKFTPSELKREPVSV